MDAVLVIAGVVLILIILGLTYRVFNLVSIVKGDANKRVGLSNKVNAIMFPVFFTVGMLVFFWYSGIAKEYFLPEAASLQGAKIDTIYWVTMLVVILVFVATNFLLFFFSYWYRYKEGRSAYFFPDNDKLEIIWTIVPAIVLTVLVVWGWRVWTDITSAPPKDAIEIEIMGKQFNWQVRYGGKDGKVGNYDFRKIDATNSMGVDFTDQNSLDDFQPREIHLPKGKNVLLRIRSRDVLHSVYLPHFRVKMDAVPGMKTRFWFTPTISTKEMRDKLKNQDFNYELACTELCGVSHYAMRMVVIVDEPAEFDKWFNEQEPWAKKNAKYVSSLNLDKNQPVSLASKEN